MSETTFNTLPREILGIILDHVNPTDQQKFRRISIYWNKNICSLYGATLAVNNKNLDLNLASTACPIKAYFQSLTLPISMNEIGTSFLNRLTSLTLTGHVVCYNIFPILEYCTFVRKLELIAFNRNLQMKEYEVNKDDPSKLLPELRALTVKFDYRPSIEPEYNFLEKLLPFFTSDEGKLDTIIIDSPRGEGPLQVAFHNIFKNNLFQKLTDELSPPELNFDDTFYHQLIKSNLQSLQNLEMADGSFGFRFNMKILSETADSGDSEIQFTEFEQSLYSYLKKHALSYYINHITLFNLLKSQTHLVKLEIGVSLNFTLEQACFIANNNATTLAYFTVWYCYGRQHIRRLDASALSELTTLKMFKFSKFTSGRGQEYFGEESTERVFNIKSLPSSLRSFSTTATLEFEDRDSFNMTVFESLQHLETLELLAVPFFHFGNEKIYQMDATKIRQLIAWLPSLKKLVIRNERPYIFPGNQVQNINEDEEEEEEDGLNIHMGIDTLPNSATAWINNDTRINIEKTPIIPCSRPFCGNPDLIGQQPEWDWNQMEMDRYEYLVLTSNTNSFPAHFDGVISVEPEFREHSPLPE